mgnify:CR=1 FL=1
MAPFWTEFGVDIEVPLLWYIILVNIYTDVLNYYQTNTIYLVYWPALLITPTEWPMPYQICKHSESGLCLDVVE